MIDGKNCSLVVVLLCKSVTVSAASLRRCERFLQRLDLTYRRVQGVEWVLLRVFRRGNVVDPVNRAL